MRTITYIGGAGFLLGALADKAMPSWLVLGLCCLFVINMGMLSVAARRTTIPRTDNSYHWPIRNLIAGTITGVFSLAYLGLYALSLRGWGFGLAPHLWITAVLLMYLVTLNIEDGVLNAPWSVSGEITAWATSLVLAWLAYYSGSAGIIHHLMLEHPVLSAWYILAIGLSMLLMVFRERALLIAPAIGGLWAAIILASLGGLFIRADVLIWPAAMSAEGALGIGAVIIGLVENRRQNANERYTLAALVFGLTFVLMGVITLVMNA